LSWQKKMTGVTADDITLTQTCTAKSNKVDITVYVPNKNTKDAATVKGELTGVSKADLKTLIDAAYATVSELGTTKPTVTEPAAVIVAAAAPVEVFGEASEVSQTLKFTFDAATAKKANCPKMTTGSTELAKIATALQLFATDSVAAQYTYPGVTACTGTEALIPYVQTNTRSDKKSAASGKAAIDTQTASVAKLAGTNGDGTDAGSVYKHFVDSTELTAGDLATPFVTVSVAAAETKQTAAETVSGTVDITVTDYAECKKLKANAAIVNIKEYLITKTNALYGDIVATVSCAAAVANLYISVTSPVANGNTLASTVKTKLDAITAWGADIKAAVDPVLGTALAKSEKAAAVTFTKAAVVTAQADAMLVSGSVVYAVSNRADCQDLADKSAEIQKKIEAAAGVDASTSNTAVVTCADKVATLTYTILTAKSVAPPKTAQDVLDKLNLLDDAGWKKIITDSLAAATAVTLDDATALAVTTINGATKALTTTTSTTSSTTGATVKYVAMSKITGALSMTATESDCLNMKDAAGAAALASAILTISTAPTATPKATCAVTTDCTTKTKPVVTYTIHTPTAGTPTPTAIKAVIDAVTAADWDTKLTKAIKDASLTEPTISAVTQSTAATITSITTTMGPTTSYTGTTTKGTAKQIKGSLSFEVGSAAECANMQGTNGIKALKSMLKDVTGMATTNIACTVTCSARRRLSDGRRLAGKKVGVAYTIDVPAGSTVSATAVEANLKAVDNAAWTTKVTTALAAEKITVTVSKMAKTDPTVTTVHTVSSALMLVASPFVASLSMMQFLL